jgi:hypothetical protein
MKREISNSLKDENMKLKDKSPELNGFIFLNELGRGACRNNVSDECEKALTKHFGSRLNISEKEVDDFIKSFRLLPNAYEPRTRQTPEERERTQLENEEWLKEQEIKNFRDPLANKIDYRNFKIKVYDKDDIHLVYKRHYQKPGTILFSNDFGMTWHFPTEDSSKWEKNYIFTFIQA